MKLTDNEKVYFGCTGNTCRSPMAQRILMEHLKDIGVTNIDVQSRMSQVKQPVGMKDSDHDLDFSYFEDFFIAETKDNKAGGLSAGSERIIDLVYGDKEFIEAHSPKAFTPEELEEAGLVMVMSRSHKDNLLRNTEAWTSDKRSKVYTLGELVGKPHIDVRDPFGAGMVMSKKKGEKPKKNIKEETKVYSETFKQLNEFIGEVVKAESLPTQTFDGLFFNQMRGIIYFIDNPPKVKAPTNAERVIDSRKREMNLSPIELYHRGNYVKAIEETKRDAVKSVEVYSKMMGAVIELERFNGSPVELGNRIHQTVIPGIISGGYMNDDLLIDNNKIIDAIREPILEAMGTIPNTVVEGNLEAGFAAQDFTIAALDIANKGNDTQFKREIATYALGK